MASEAAGMGMQMVGNMGAMASESANMVVGTIFGLLQMAMQNRAYEDTKYAAAGLGEYIESMGYAGAGQAKNAMNIPAAQKQQLKEAFPLNQPGPIPNTRYPNYA